MDLDKEELIAIKNKKFWKNAQKNLYAPSNTHHLINTNPIDERIKTLKEFLDTNNGYYCYNCFFNLHHEEEIIRDVLIENTKLKNENKNLKEDKQVVVCPVCYGTGNVQSGFYSGRNEYGGYVTNSTGVETCRSCKGKGYLII